MSLGRATPWCCGWDLSSSQFQAKPVMLNAPSRASSSGVRLGLVDCARPAEGPPRTVRRQVGRRSRPSTMIGHARAGGRTGTACRCRRVPAPTAVHATAAMAQHCVPNQSGALMGTGPSCGARPPGFAAAVPAAVLGPAPGSEAKRGSGAGSVRPVHRQRSIMPTSRSAACPFVRRRRPVRRGPCGRPTRRFTRTVEQQRFGADAQNCANARPVGRETGECCAPTTGPVPGTVSSAGCRVVAPSPRLRSFETAARPVDAALIQKQRMLTRAPQED